MAVTPIPNATLRCRTRQVSQWLLALSLVIACSDADPAAPKAAEKEAVSRRSLYVAARDGTRLAVDAHLPEGWRSGEQLPAVVRITRYWRAIESTGGDALEDPYAEAILGRGFAYVTMDVRGSGASFGVSTAPWSEEEVLDYRDLLDWIVEQPWSNGRVGALGDSYEGNTAALLSALGHPAVRAVAPRFFDWDPYLSPAFPGGLFHEDFIRSWSDMTTGLDSADVCAAARAESETQCALVSARIRGPLRVDEDVDGKLLAEAIKEHQANTEVYPALDAITYRNDDYGDRGTSLSEVSLYSYARQINEGSVPWFSWASWFDSATAEAALSAFLTLDNPQEVVIGAWSHGGQFDADPYEDPDSDAAPSLDEQMDEVLSFLGRYLVGDESPPQRNIRYYTAGEGKWRDTDTWPPSGTKSREWFLAPDGQLATEEPREEGQDAYDVDFSANSGAANRWATQKDGRDVVYDDRESTAEKLLTYTSQPLSESLRLVGHPSVDLFVSSSREDSALIVYLEDVSPQGKVTYLTEGELRLLHRKPSETPYETLLAPLSFEREDGTPLAPDRVERVRLTLLPIAALIAKDHRIRVTLAGHDAASFRRYPADGEVTFTFVHSPSHASKVTLPVMSGMK